MEEVISPLWTLVEIEVIIGLFAKHQGKDRNDVAKELAGT